MHWLLPLAIADPVSHVTDKPLWQVGDIWVISNVTVMLILGAVVTYLLIVPAAQRIDTGKQRTLDDFRAEGLLANLVETVCVYLREDVFRPVLGEETDNYAPLLWTLFWFILVCNLLGLVPILDVTALIANLAFGTEKMHDVGFHGIGGTATQSIWVTGTLAIISACFYMGVGLVKDPVGFFKHLTGGAPVFMWPIMIPVEVLGYIIKPFALAIRLFANMTGGHLVIAVLLSFIAAAVDAMGFVGATGISVISVAGAVAINLLEILVAFIQAYIFMFLTCLFLAQLVVHEHDEHDEHAAHTPVGDVDLDAALEVDGVPLRKAH
jgi:F-type H+-transporting ATPase subunit a